MESSITRKHVDRGRQMKALVTDEIRNGVPFETALENLAEYLEIEVAAVRLGVAIGIAYDRGRLAGDGHGGFTLGSQS